MEGVFLKNLNRINNSKGDILHALKKSESSYKGFGEAYFSLIKYDQIKGWKKHTKMTMNLIVPVGEIKFVLYDNRDNKIEPIFTEFIIGQSNYKRLTIPPNIFVSFKGLDEKMNLLLNVADLEHDPDEAVNIELKEINYNW